MIVTVAGMLVVLVFVAAQARAARQARPGRGQMPPEDRRRRGRLRYRVWAGMGLWLGATAIDVALVSSAPAWWPHENAGALSLIGFTTAFAWALFDPARRGR